MTKFKKNIKSMFSEKSADKKQNAMRIKCTIVDG